jgi:hypothetical protein
MYDYVILTLLNGKILSVALRLSEFPTATEANDERSVTAPETLVLNIFTTGRAGG